MKRLLISLLLVSPAVLGQTVATVNGKHEVIVTVNKMDVTVEKQCKEKFCDSADEDCDGVLDTVCPGLTYDVCVDGSVVDSYIEAALTGFCLEADQGDVDPDCTGQVLVVGPGSDCE